MQPDQKPTPTLKHRKLFTAVLLTALTLLSACRTLSGNDPQLSAAAVCGTTNEAANKSTTASSSENPEFLGPRFTTDNNLSTRWSSAFTDPQWLQVDLGSAQTVCGLELRWEASYGKAFRIEVSNDQQTWTKIYETSTGTGGVQTITPTVSASGRYVRLTGTQRGSASGALYGYSLYEFRVFTGETAPPPACGTTNLALNKPATASTTESPAFTADQAFDGSSVTRWASERSDPQWLQVDLGSAQTVCGVSVNWEEAYAQDYRIEVSSDQQNWTKIYETSLGRTDALGGRLPLSATATGRYLRLTGTERATGYGYSVRELAVYGSESSTPPGGTTPTGPTVKISGNKRAYASTSQDRGVDPAFAIDSDPTTRWSSGFSAKAWLMVDLGAPARLDRAELLWETAWSSRYTIEVSNDRTTWTPVGGQQTNPRVGGGAPTPPAAEYRDTVVLNLTQPYRYIRMNSAERGWSAGDGSQYGVSLYDFAVYGAGGQDDPTPVGEPPAPTGNTWVLKWQDEFDSGATPLKVDASRWNYETGPRSANGEREYNTDSLSNVAVQNGLLNITARKNDGGHAYTSGRINTLGKAQFTYGRISARIRLQTPTTAAGVKDGPVGVWAAFWMLGADFDDPYSGWPNSGEIDIMENIGYSWWYSASLHGPGYSGAASLGESYNKRDTPTGIAAGSYPDYKSTDWHIYEVEWEADRIVFKLDGQPYRTLTRAEVDGRGYWVFNKPQFIILNLAYGGAYPGAYLGNPDNFTGAKTEGGLAAMAENNFPHTMQVDWVRVYGRQ